MKITIKECSSCKKDHASVELTKLQKPVTFKGQVWTHYANCPNTGQIVYWCAAQEEDTTFIGKI